MNQPRISPKNINAELLEFYSEVVRSFFQTSSIADGYVGPFLISCPHAFDRLQTPWMYVGQETFGWRKLLNESDVAQQVEEHRSFDLANGYRGAGAPFWSFAHELDRWLNPNGPARSFVWSNLARIGKANEVGRVPSELLDFWTNNRLLAKEIETIQPHMVLFVTGPDGDELLHREFQGIEMEALSKARPIGTLRHPELPRLSFRSYHPNWLRFKKLEPHVREFILSTVSCKCARLA